MVKPFMIDYLLAACRSIRKILSIINIEANFTSFGQKSKRIFLLDGVCGRPVNCIECDVEKVVHNMRGVISLENDYKMDKSPCRDVLFGIMNKNYRILFQINNRKQRESSWDVYSFFF